MVPDRAKHQYAITYADTKCTNSRNGYFKLRWRSSKYRWAWFERTNKVSPKVQISDVVKVDTSIFKNTRMKVAVGDAILTH